ncbi:hypothetical protein BGZ58_000033 [Dissophora ornata]|nr:hypothetical protein BGZ58_000033 [Dissophora ornata]
MAPIGDTPQSYAWTPESNQDQLAIMADELSAVISELEFRAHLLNHLEENSDFKVDSVDCVGAKEVVKSASTTIKDALSVAQNIPVLAKFLDYVKVAIDNLNNTVDSALAVGKMSAYFSVNMAFTAARLTLRAVAFGQLEPMITPLVKTLNGIQSPLNDVIKCAIGTTRKIDIEPSHCDDLANIYRLVISESTKTSPALNLPAGASGDLKRLAAGSLSLLDLLDRSSIASTNDALLATRPIFAADLMEQFRTELLRVGDTEEIRNYAQVALGAVVGISNSLEACLRVAADPIGAIDELNEELEAQTLKAEEGTNEDADEDKKAMD